MKYSHVISLGFFCGVALEIERQGLRDGSYPFDWCISKDWMGLEKAIMTNYKDFLSYECMSQSISDPNNYKNEYNVQFFHDFTKFNTLKEQLPDIKSKYRRRIDKFYTNIKEPTLFIRYINDDNGKDEIEYWNNNSQHLENFLKTYNSNNKIVFIANSELANNYRNIEVYYAEKEEHSTIAKQPLILNRSIQKLFEQIEYDEEQKNRNIIFYKSKMKQKAISEARNRRFMRRVVNKIYDFLKPIKYHNKTY